jgi:hypothetical protein
MAAYVYEDTCGDIPVHTEDICDPGEQAGIRSIVLMKKGFNFDNPSDATEWQNAIAAESIIIIHRVNGDYDGGKPKYGTGYGDAESTYLGSDHTLKYNDPTYVDNVAFYNSLRGSRNWKLAFRTDTQIHLVNKPVSFSPMAPVKEGLEERVIWNVECKWTYKDSPIPYDIPTGIFDVTP